MLATRTFFTKPRGYPAAQLCCRWWVSAAAGAGERRHEDRLVEHCGQCAAVHRGKVGTPVGAKQVSTVQAGQETAGEGVARADRVHNGNRPSRAVDHPVRRGRQNPIGAECHHDNRGATRPPRRGHLHWRLPGQEPGKVFGAPLHQVGRFNEPSTRGRRVSGPPISWGRQLGS
jgi:hypothetical protein